MFEMNESHFELFDQLPPGPFEISKGKEIWLQQRNDCRKWQRFLEQLQIILQKMDLEFAWTVFS